MIRRILLLATITLLAGCGSIRGTQVEAGYGQATESYDAPATGFEPTEATDATAAPAAPTASATTAELDEPVTDTEARVIPVLSAKPPVELGDDNASDSFDFRARELYSGSTINGNDLFGQGQVLVTFVQPGCDISAEGGLTIAEVADLHPEAIYVIVHSGADDDAYIEFAETAELFQENMVHISDHLGALATRYGVEDYPTTLLITSDLQMSAVTGVMDTDAQIEAVQAVKTEQL